MSTVINDVLGGELFVAGIAGASLFLVLLVATINILVFAAVLMVVWNWSMRISHPMDTDDQLEKRKMPYITAIGIILLVSFVLSFFKSSPPKRA